MMLENAQDGLERLQAMSSEIVSFPRLQIGALVLQRCSQEVSPCCDRSRVVARWTEHSPFCMGAPQSQIAPRAAPVNSLCPLSVRRPVPLHLPQVPLVLPQCSDPTMQ